MLIILPLPSWVLLFFPSFCFLSFSLLSFVSFSLLLFSVSSLQPPLVPCHSDRVLCVCVCLSGSETTQGLNRTCDVQHPPPPQPANLSNPTTPPQAHITSSSSPLQHRLPFPNTGTPHHPPLQKYPTRGKFKSPPMLLPPLMALGFQVLQLVVEVVVECN